MKISATKNPSDRLTTLLVAYNLCKDAIDHDRVLKDYVTESMFHAGVIAYYSIFKNPSDKKWLEDILSGSKPIQGRVGIRYRDQNQDEDIGRYYLNVFKKFESIRDKNIAHKDPERSPENKLEHLQIPNGVAGSDALDGAVYITQYVFLSLDIKDKLEFLNLVCISIDILWQKESLEIHRLGPDGNVYPVAQPHRTPVDDENL